MSDPPEGWDYSCGVPTAAVATGGNARATLTWNAPVSSGGAAITSYVITPFIGGVAQSVVISSGPITTKVVSGLTNGTVYTFRVAARNSVGTSAQSSASNAVLPLDTSIDSLSAGHDHTCGVLMSGGVRCWGRSTSGQLGNGFHAYYTTPQPLVW